MHIWVEDRSQPWVSFFSLVLVFVCLLVCLLRQDLFIDLAWLVRPGWLPNLTGLNPPALGYKCTLPCLAFLCDRGFWGENLSPHACGASALFTEPSSWLHSMALMYLASEFHGSTGCTRSSCPAQGNTDHISSLRVHSKCVTVLTALSM